MRTSHAFEFDEFPSDDNLLWWIRWVDNITLSHRGTSTAGIVVYFSSIPEDTLFSIQADKNPSQKFRDYQKQAKIQKIHIQATNLPALVIGTLFKNGTSQGSLIFSQKEISCDTSCEPQQLVQANQAHHISPPWWDVDKYGEYCAINRSEYALGDACNSWLCSVRSNSVDFLIPCSEIFRYFYCWHSQMARIFTAGPWKNNFNQAIQEKNSGIDENDENIWHLTARKGFSLDHCKLLTPLFHDPTGFERANEIFTDFHNEKAAQGSYGIPIKAKIPFRDGPIKLNAQGIWLREEVSKFLVFRIIGHDWPYKGKTLVRNIETDNRQGKVRIPVDSRIPFGGTVPPGKLPDTEINDIVTSENDPNPHRGHINFKIPAPIVDGVHEIRPEKEVSRIYVKKPPYLEPSMVGGDKASTGNPDSGGSDKSGDFVPIANSDIDRFEQLLKTLKEWELSGKISGFATIAPPPESPESNKQPIGYKNVSLWKMPKSKKLFKSSLAYSAWSMIIKDSHKRPRGALIAKLIYKSKHILVMEIEARDTEGGYRALLFRPSCMDGDQDAINDVLHYVVTRNGNIEKEPQISNNILAAIGWKHAYAYVKKEATEKEEATKIKTGIHKISLEKAFNDLLQM